MTLFFFIIINIMTKNNYYWNESHENGLLLIHKYSNEMYKKYHVNYNKYKISLQRYRIPIIILSSVSGFLSISNSGYIPTDYNKWISLIVGFSNLLVSLVSLIENFKKIDTTLIKSQDSYMAFKRINDEVSIILRLPRDERDDDGHTALLKYFQLFENTYNTAPILKGEVIDMLELHQSITFTDILVKDDDFTKIKVEDIMLNGLTSIKSSSGSENKLKVLNNKIKLVQKANTKSVKAVDVPITNEKQAIVVPIVENDKKNI